MKKLISILLITASTTVFAFTPDKYFGNCDNIVSKEIYKSCYNYNLKGTTAVLYSIDGNALNGDYIQIKKRPAFYVENSIPVKYRSYPDDYTRTGYDRGHMANHADFNYSANLVYLTYSMANIVPQNKEVNEKTWLKAEKYERLVAKQFGSVNVLNIVQYSNNPERIGKHQVAVPSGFIKVIFNNSQNFEKCFYYKNENPSYFDNLRSHEINCNTI